MIHLLSIYILISSDVCIINSPLMFSHDWIKLFHHVLTVHLLIQSLRILFLLLFIHFLLLLTLHVLSISLGFSQLSIVLISCNLILFKHELHPNLRTKYLILVSSCLKPILFFLLLPINLLFYMKVLVFQVFLIKSIFFILPIVLQEFIK